ncbi:hypothetical protein QCA50_001423 [Cerrena zonata]|uniref:Uncharacterized protein n=1 Tax=Cerrena zonata TaxID=2478898 RepID=A0AAW0GKY6_9APHY
MPDPSQNQQDRPCSPPYLPLRTVATRPPIPGDLSSFELNQSLLLLHHDGGPIMLNDGTNVYESPPGYGEVQAQDRARSPPPARLEPQRRPGHKRAQTSNI